MDNLGTFPKTQGVDCRTCLQSFNFVENIDMCTYIYIYHIYIYITYIYIYIIYIYHIYIYITYIYHIYMIYHIYI